MRDMIDFDHGKARVTNIAKGEAGRGRPAPARQPARDRHDHGLPRHRHRRAPGEARPRARGNVKAYLMERHGIDASRITTTIDMTDTENRTRAVLVTITP